MNRGNIINNISKLNTFIIMSKTNDYLRTYVEKLFDKKSKKIKFINDFDANTIDLLYSSLQLMNNKGSLSPKDYNKIDKKELKYYIDKSKGLKHYNKQCSSIKTEEQLLNAIKNALEEGAYTCNYDNTIKLDNGLIFDIKWFVSFVNYLSESLSLNRFLSTDAKTYTYRIVEINNNSTNNYDQFVKNIHIYDYKISTKTKTTLSFADVKYLTNMMNNIIDYDFEKLKELNSELAKSKFTLSVNKNYPTFTKDQKEFIKKQLNEENHEFLIEYIKNTFDCVNSTKNYNHQKYYKVYDCLKALGHAYKNNYELEECRQKIDLINREDMLCAITMGDFYINYIYDEKSLNEGFMYEELKLDELKPEKIDYETQDYKNIISKLSNTHKRLIGDNRKINKYLIRNKENEDDNLTNLCQSVDKNIEEIKLLRKELTKEKEINLSKSNVNKKKIDYIKLALINGNYKYYDNKIILSANNSKYQKIFKIEIPFNDFIGIVLSDYNKNLRIDYYQK